MPHGVDRSCIGTIERVFTTSRQFGVHRQGLRLARGRFRWRKFFLYSAGVITAIGVVSFASLIYSGTPIERFNRFYWWGGIISWIFSLLFSAFGSLYESVQDASNDFDELSALHDYLPSVAWEVRLESGEILILKGFSGRSGDQIGVNFIGEWTPSILNISEIERGATVREQLALQFQNSDHSPLFPWPDEYQLFKEGESSRIREFGLRIGKSLISTTA